MAEQLTKLESSVYHYLLDFTAENTYQPSIRDIGKQFKIKSTKTVSDLLQSLARKGYIERDPARSRGVNLLGFGAAMRTQPVPFYGKIHAGEPALVPEHRQGFITLDRRFIPSEDVFFLKVKGDSMVGRCITEGDYVLVNPHQDPKDNDIVAARLGEEATVKTYKKRNGAVVLEAANPAERDITVQPGTDFGVLGVVCGVFRPGFDANIGGNSIPS
ncbi:MAG TPA: transcriptional repressor LexA [Gemmatimonadaceae bacterium]|jgi:repressor LexA|nr:transcriptional repressor LexA [Gemmatimonadaceae bacterium]